MASKSLDITIIPLMARLLSRNLFFITNVSRVVRLKLSRELTQTRNVIVSSHEALAAGVPIVSTPVSGTDEALRPEADGIAPGRVVDFDAGAVADGLRTLLADEPLRERMGRAAAHRAAREFAFPRVLDRWEQVLGGRWTSTRIAAADSQTFLDGDERA